MTQARQARAHYSGKITLTWIGVGSDSRFNGARAGGGERGEGLERGERCPIIRIIDDSFPAYDRERLIGRNGVKSRASCRASFCHPRPGEDRSFLAATLPSILSRARF